MLSIIDFTDCPGCSQFPITAQYKQCIFDTCLPCFQNDGHDRETNIANSFDFKPVVVVVGFFCILSCKYVVEDLRNICCLSVERITKDPDLTRLTS